MFKVSAWAGRKPMMPPTSAKNSAKAKTAHRLARRPNTADIDISRTRPATATATAERGTSNLTGKWGMKCKARDADPEIAPQPAERRGSRVAAAEPREHVLSRSHAETWP